MSLTRRATMVPLGAGLLVFGAACTLSDAPDEAPASPPAASPTGATATASEAPLAIVVHPHRGTLSVSEALAMTIITGGVDNWSALGQGNQPLTVIDSGLPEHRIQRVATDPNAIAAVPAGRVDPRVRVLQVAHHDPLTEPSNYPLLRSGPTPPEPVTVSVVGDIMMARGVAAAMGDDRFAPLRPTADRLRSADLTIGNLESSLSQEGTPTQGTDSFGADPGVLPEIERAGFDVLSLANNHVGDYGQHALEQTVNRLDRSSIQRVGAGMNASDAWRPAVLSVNGTRIGVLAFNAIGESPAATTSTPGVVQLRMPPRTGPLNQADLRAMVEEVRTLRARTDAVLVLPHWGEQYTSRALDIQRHVARRLTVAGATAVIGSHPHWVQGVELIDEGFVAYSLGNFVFDMDFSVPTMQGITLELTFWDGELMSANPVPVAIDRGFITHYASGRVAHDIVDDVWSNSFGSFAR